MTLEELKQAAAESSTKDAIVAAIVESEEFNLCLYLYGWSKNLDAAC